MQSICKGWFKISSYGNSSAEPLEDDWMAIAHCIALKVCLLNGAFTVGKTMNCDGQK